MSDVLDPENGEFKESLEEEEMMLDFYKNGLVIDLFCNINQKALFHFRKCLWLLQSATRKNNLEIKKKNTTDFILEPTINISSEGGDGTVGLAMHDLIRSSDVPVTTVGLGEVCSAAFIVFLGGAKRLAHENTLFMAHEIAPHLNDLKRQQQENVLEQARKIDELFRKIILRNSTLKPEQLDELQRFETYITAEDALRWGLIQRII